VNVLEKVVAYCRVSTNSKDQENSFENQHRFFLDRSTKTNSEELVTIYADKGISGTSLKKRDEFKKMLFDAGINEYRGRDEFTYEIDKKRPPKFKKIYVRNTSRFTRDVSIVSILRALCRNGVYVHFLDIDLIYDDISKEFMLNLFINFSQQESVDKSKKVRDGNGVTALRGSIRVGGYGVYGYLYSIENKDLTIIKEEAKVVRIVYDLYLNSGYGIRRIANHLEENGYKTRSGKDRFSISTLKRILTNEKYYGCNVRNKYDSGTVFNKNIAKIKPVEEWIYHDGTIPPIVSKEDFSRAQEINKNNIHSTTQKGIYRGQSEYAGKIVCGVCGENYVKNVDDGRVFYNCTVKKNRGTKVCNGINISEKIISDTVIKILENGVEKSFEQYKNTMITYLKLKVRGKIANKLNKKNEEGVAKLNKDAVELNDQKNRLGELYISGQFDASFLDTKAVGLNVQIETINESIKMLSKSNKELYQELEEFDSIISEMENTRIKGVLTKEELMDYITIEVSRSPENKRKAVAECIYKYDTKIKKIASKYGVIKGVDFVINAT